MSLRIVDTIVELRRLLDRHRAEGRSVGFVPTMGYLHDGHASLLRAAVTDADVTVLSIFVNPLQFAPDEDLSAYPRDLGADVALADAVGVDYVFHPTVDEMYPVPILTEVTVAELAGTLEGASRPSHFAGVSTVVSKLFGIVGPCRAYFGEKDYQQLAIVRRLALDLSMPVEVIGRPTIREPDGLARSSRNVYLSTEERVEAPVLFAALQLGRQLIEAGERRPDVVQTAMSDLISEQPHAELDYVAVVDASTLQPVAPLQGEVRLLVACRFGRARLIDNVGAAVPEG